VVTGNKRLTRLFPGESLVIRQLTSRIAQSRSTGRLTSTYPRVNLCKRDMPTQAYLPDRDPVIPSELVHNPLAAESPKTAILLASEGTRRRIVYPMIVDMSHASLNTQPKSQAALSVAWLLFRLGNNCAHAHDLVLPEIGSTRQTDSPTEFCGRGFNLRTMPRASNTVWAGETQENQNRQ